MLSLSEIAYYVYCRHKMPITTREVGGALAALHVRLTTVIHQITLTGDALYRQQTLVHKSRLRHIVKYLTTP